MELYGDVRVRYEYRGGRTAGVMVRRDIRNDWQERKRERYRLRLGLRGTLVDDWFFGLRLETSTSPRSTNVTFGDDSSNGPFAKNSDGISVGQAYLGYKGFRDITSDGWQDAEPPRDHARWSGTTTSIRKGWPNNGSTPLISHWRRRCSTDPSGRPTAKTAKSSWPRSRPNRSK